MAEEVLREENATDEDVDAFHRSDKSQILNNAIFGRSLVATPRDPEVVVNAEASPAVVPSQPAAPLAPLAPTASTPGPAAAAMDMRPPPEPTAQAPAVSPPADDQSARVAELERRLEALAVAKARSDELAAKEKARADHEKARADELERAHAEAQRRLGNAARAPVQRDNVGHAHSASRRRGRRTASASAASEAKKPTPKKKKKRQSKSQNVSDSSDESDDDDDDDDEEEVHGDASAAYRDAVRERAARDEVPRADGQFGGYTSDDLDAVIALHPRDAIAASYALADRHSVKRVLRRRNPETSRS